METYTHFGKDDWYVNLDPKVTPALLEKAIIVRDLIYQAHKNQKKVLALKDENVNTVMPLVYANQGAEGYDWREEDVFEMMRAFNVWIEHVFMAWIEKLKKKSLEINLSKK